MIETVTKYICDYCKNEVSYTEYTQGVKISIRAELAHPEGKCGQVAGHDMNLCKDCSEDLGIENTQEYHAYTYSQGRLRDAIREARIKITDILFGKNQRDLGLEFEMLEYGDAVELVNGDICVYIRRELDTSGGMITQELNLVNIFTGEEHNINDYLDDLAHETNPSLSVKKFAN